MVIPKETRDRLAVLPCLDSPELATALRKEVQVSVWRAVSLGHSALEAIESGRYRTADGRIVDWSQAVRIAREARRSIPADAADNGDVLIAPS